MGDQDAFERILASLYDAMLDDTEWPAVSALIDEACGASGNAMIVEEAPENDFHAHFAGLYYRGERRTDLEREYFEVYRPIDELVPRHRRLAYGRLVRVPDLYTAEELKTSPAYNEAMLEGKFQDGLTVRLSGAGGTAFLWGHADPVDSDGWGNSQIAMIKRLVPEIRQFFRVRQALVRAESRAMTAATLLENVRIGVVHLDRRGRAIAVNDRAQGILRDGDALSDRDGELRALAPDDQARLDRLVAAAMPGTVAVSGSMPLRRASVRPPLVAHVIPVRVPQPHYGVRYVAALVLLADPARPDRIAPGAIGTVLGLTPGESQVAAWLAEGMSVEQMARTTGHTRGAIYWHLKQIYQKLNISRQADLVRLVLSIAQLG